ncbi:MAG: DUF1501 domain-containing protein [Bdellovibrionales bacterium]|nr:DUF1501 domain-containing protein [Bdellovibrionales bacterium]
MKKNKCTRRDALQIMGAATLGAGLQRSVLNVLMGSIVSGMADRALAQATGVKPRKHLFVQMVGAPPRWTFDLFLTPYSSTGFVPSAMVGTSYIASNGRYTANEYKTVNLKGLNVPWLWQFNTTKAGGGMRPMADLMNNMLTMRGIDIEDFQHESAQAKAFLPVSASTSLVALAAMNSGTPIPALDVHSTFYTFRSSTNITPVRLLTNGNLISTLLDPFVSKTGATFSSKQAALSSFINESLASLQTYAVSRHPGAASIFESQKGADKLLRGALGDLTSIWNTLYGKYNDIVKRAILPATEPMAGITDLPIGDTTRNNRYRVYGTSIINATDVRTIFNSAYIPRLAEHFALAEYVLLNNISGSITIAPQQFFGIPGNLDLYFDEHETGDMISLVSNSLYNRAFAGCMLELIDRLKAANLFNETVIDVRGEFGRFGRDDGSGSDHAGAAGIASFYSGIIQGPMVVGNVRNNSGGAGSYGDAAPVTTLGGTNLDGGNMSASIATLLRAPSPVTARGTVLAEQNGKIVSLIEAPKQV